MPLHDRPRPAQRQWIILVPLKRLPVAKTRLRGAVPGVDHAELVLAMAHDTVRAAGEVAPVTVVSDDERVRSALSGLVAGFAPDAPDGLNAALAAAAAGLAGPVAALTGDLPALRPAELAGALAEAGRRDGAAYVADAAGSGTVLLTGSGPAWFSPGFGRDSASRHGHAGARTLTGSWPSLRRDVDTAADLREAVDLGLGPRSAALVAATLR